MILEIYTLSHGPVSFAFLSRFLAPIVMSFDSLLIPWKTQKKNDGFIPQNPTIHKFAGRPRRRLPSKDALSIRIASTSLEFQGEFLEVFVIRDIRVNGLPNDLCIRFAELLTPSSVLFLVGLNLFMLYR